MTGLIDESTTRTTNNNNSTARTRGRVMDRSTCGQTVGRKTKISFLSSLSFSVMVVVIVVLSECLVSAGVERVRMDVCVYTAGEEKKIGGEEKSVYVSLGVIKVKDERERERGYL